MKFHLSLPLFVITLLILMSFTFAQTEPVYTSTGDDYNFIAANDIFMWVSNNGDGSHNPITDGGGFYWPGGEEATIPAIFEDGLIWAGQIEKGDSVEIRMSGNTHRQGIQGGKIISPMVPDDPALEKYRVYKIKKGWENLPPGNLRDRYEKDYKEWPVEDGAPYNDRDGDGKFTPGFDTPQYYGDETLWYVSNDANPERTTFTYGTMPIGLEFQTTVWGYDNINFLRNVVFKKYKIIHKGIDTVKNMYLGYWSDPDLGFAGDDYVGCDTTLNMAYVYNGDNIDDDYYKKNPPALGYVLLQGPIVKGNPDDAAVFNNQKLTGFKNLGMTSFVFYFDPFRTREPEPYGPSDFYNNLQGYIWNGEPFVDPNTIEPTKFILAGDPVNETGWYEGSGWPGGPSPDDRRMLMSTGPFSFAPGDTQEVVIAILIERSSDNISSITELRESARKTKIVWDYFEPLAAEEYKEVFPEYFYLSNNYPNPFNPSTAIKYELPIEQFVSLKVYNSIGEEVQTLASGWQQPGKYEVKFDGSNLASGVYLYRFETQLVEKIGKMMLIK
ncbi:MAG: T9SS type A sorting domain-containing protein [Melioribacteraceae bacterium]|nr:T9SS type A sorting domain-containing protein [Melioribacteraceae bacterium]MCF8396024.1 T9SS type A sorting domain-containing protein [Melioribacteraceae bacterium]MCF8421051.1 T9SS type A sorting domain-containing protein [Melioribacteraceae bacterium]